MRDNSQLIVSAGNDKYPVIFSDHRRRLASILDNSAKMVVISNATVFALHGRRLLENILPRPGRVESVMIGDGERYKTQKTANLLYDHLFDIGLGREDAIVAFGGGVVGDVAGYVAGTFKRGVKLIQIPTTLLSMVDASVGGKTAVNHRLGKNLIGTFYQPLAVAVESQWLVTLGRREMIEGIAEILKAGFLSSKKLLQEAVAISPGQVGNNQIDLLPVIRKAIKFKAGVVSRDVYDRGGRAILNFGHTFGHAIEKAEGYRRYRHGEAVLAGMIGGLYLSHATGQVSKTVMQELLQYLKPFIKRLRPLKKVTNDYVSPIDVDKKNRSGRRVFVLLAGIGRPVVRVVGSQKKVIESIEFMKAYVNSRGEM
jgi:3-dehydroquinate synthase